jgi:hypothetical protein
MELASAHQVDVSMANMLPLAALYVNFVLFLAKLVVVRQSV